MEFLEVLTPTISVETSKMISPVMNSLRKDLKKYLKNLRKFKVNPLILEIISPPMNSKLPYDVIISVVFLSTVMCKNLFFKLENGENWGKGLLCHELEAVADRVCRLFSTHSEVRDGGDHLVQAKCHQH